MSPLPIGPQWPEFHDAHECEFELEAARFAYEQARARFLRGEANHGELTETLALVEECLNNLEIAREKMASVPEQVERLNAML